MSKITNDGLTRSGSGCFIAVSTYMATVGIKRFSLPFCHSVCACYICGSEYRPNYTAWNWIFLRCFSSSFTSLAEKLA